MGRSRKPEIMADVAYAILCRSARSYSGHFVLDEGILREDGMYHRLRCL
jgi:citronellol/citronellal dehydrogenase